MRYELTDHEWASIKPMLPNKPRGVPRVNDRRVLNGIFWVLRSLRSYQQSQRPHGRRRHGYIPWALSFLIHNVKQRVGPVI